MVNSLHSSLLARLQPFTHDCIRCIMRHCSHLILLSSHHFQSPNNHLLYVCFTKYVEMLSVTSISAVMAEHLNNLNIQNDDELF